MKNAHNAPQTTARSLALILAASLFAGCGAGNHMLPPAPPAGTGAADSAGAQSLEKEPSGERVSVRMQIRIPRRDRRVHDRHPATISALTQSVGIAMNGGAQHVFNATPASPNCSIGAGGTLCTFAIAANVGTDSFVVTTYAGANGGGTALDRGTATVPVKKGKANAIVVRLGGVVTTTADSGVGSLRYAVATANSGDTIMFLLPSGSTIALASPIVVTGDVAIAGPGAASPISIGGGNAHQIFFITGSATISGLTLTQGKAPVSSAPGGAIANTGALTLANDIFGSNTSVAAVKRSHKPHALAVRRHPHCTTTYVEGGALYNAGTLVMSGNTFNGNFLMSDPASCVEGEGGAIYNEQTGTLSSTGDTFTNNSAMNGGAVYNSGVGQASFVHDTFTGNTGCTAASGCPTSGCTSSGCTTFAQGTGAAIFDVGGVTITSSTFANNIAGGASNGSTGEGGAIALGAGNPIITGSVFSGNLAGGGTASCSTGEGGAIYAAVPVVLSNDSFTSNRAAGDGMSIGGAVVDAETVEATGSAFKSNQAVALGSACSASVQAVGGAIYAGVSATLDGDTFTSNVASGSQIGSGGAVACTACYATGNTFTSNVAIGTGAAGATSVTGAGAALYAQNTVKLVGNTFASNSTSVVGPNSADAYGGAVVVIAGPLSSSGNSFTSNTVKAGGTGVGAGGAVAVTTGVALMSHDTFTSNSASGGGTAGGGAGYFAGEAVINSSNVSQNHATGGTQALGGGISTGAGAEFIHDTFAQNTSTATAAAGVGAGGALFNEDGGQIESSTFAQNTASAVGGGIVAAASESLIDVTITGNVVTAASAVNEGGGGLYAPGSIDIEQSTIAKNSVTITGPGSSGGGGIFSTNPLTLSYSTISGNAVLGGAATSGGGGIYSRGNVALENSTISNNTSKDDGGGVYIGANASVTIANVTLFKNAATGSGGNILNPFAMTLTNSIVAGGTASLGADVMNNGTLTSGDYNIIQTAVSGNAPTGTTTHNKTANPLLLALSNNGGATFTNADQATSPAKAYIPFAGSSCGGVASLTTDQRGYTRGAGGKCDVGAFEFGGVPSAARRPVRHRPAASGPNASSALHLRPIRLHPIQMPHPL